MLEFQEFILVALGRVLMLLSMVAVMRLELWEEHVATGTYTARGME